MSTEQNQTESAIKQTNRCVTCTGTGRIPWPRWMSPGFYAFTLPRYGEGMVCPACDGSGRAGAAT